ncbi:hypothetical protein [Liquorilactobacillus uvarum]|uniref:hypothetical protein n=1 Tax=Liquorilactobacillus uvarum TaxID=303240 RepID=UPI00070C704A|nr:hypothetical protein [Liquorilactobacillus uvarum]
MKKLWNANKNKVNFWISLVTFVLILSLTYAKFKFALSFTTADLTLITSALGSFIIFIGNVLNNKILVEAGQSIDSTEFGEKISETTKAVFSVQADLSKLKKELDQKGFQNIGEDKKQK